MEGLPENRGAVRRAIVQVRWGQMAWHKAIIEPGQVLQVGRAESMGLALPHDSQLADAHFELSWDGRQCWLRDLLGGSGTLLGGQRVVRGEVHNGGWVRAGQTDFSVYIERTTQPTEPEASVTPEERATRVLELLRGQAAPVFAILDAAQSERILELLRESVEECRSLYEGPQAEVLAEVAPYLVQLPTDSWLLEALVREGWGRAWGVFLVCDKPLLEVRRHFRKLLMVKAQGIDGRLYFRFYDPRVIGVFLDKCKGEHRGRFFGPVRCFIFEGADGDARMTEGQ